MSGRKSFEAVLNRLAACVPGGELLVATDPIGFLDLVVHSLATSRSEGYASGYAACREDAAKVAAPMCGLKCCHEKCDRSRQIVARIRALSPACRA